MCAQKKKLQGKYFWVDVVERVELVFEQQDAVFCDTLFHQRPWWIEPTWTQQKHQFAWRKHNSVWIIKGWVQLPSCLCEPSANYLTNCLTVNWNLPAAVYIVFAKTIHTWQTMHIKVVLWIFSNCFLISFCVQCQCTKKSYFTNFGGKVGRKTFYYYLSYCAVYL